MEESERRDDMNFPFFDKRKREEEQYRKRRRAKIAAVCDDEFLRYLDERFETGRCVFRGEAGTFDPLDAMRRDAYREVILFLRDERRKYEEDND